MLKNHRNLCLIMCYCNLIYFPTKSEMLSLGADKVESHNLIYAPLESLLESITRMTDIWFYVCLCVTKILRVWILNGFFWHTNTIIWLFNESKNLRFNALQIKISKPNKQEFLFNSIFYFVIYLRNFKLETINLTYNIFYTTTSSSRASSGALM